MPLRQPAYGCSCGREAPVGTLIALVDKEFNRLAEGLKTYSGEEQKESVGDRSE